MIGKIVSLKIKPGTSNAFEPLMRELISQVQANEPDTIVYRLMRCAEADSYQMVEIYKDMDARNRHRESDHFQRLIPSVMAFYIDKPDAAFMDVIA